MQEIFAVDKGESHCSTKERAELRSLCSSLKKHRPHRRRQPSQRPRFLARISNGNTNQGATADEKSP